jgi:poly-gamma-glutamate capsule biosynthesis protein CapA/YwtB (metallophosphatase superfamily)
LDIGDRRLGACRLQEDGSTLSPVSHAVRRPVFSFALLTLVLCGVALLTRPALLPSLTLACVGDVMLGRDVAALLDGDWAAAFDDVRPWLTEADLALANLESPLTTAHFSGGRFDLRAPPAAVGALTAAGFDLVSLANNHTLDGGLAGLAETLDTLGRAGIAALQDARVCDSGFRRTIRLANGDAPKLHVAVLAFLDNGRPLDTRALAEAVAQADLVIVSMHWGAEYYPVTERQRRLARELVAAGADLVVGHGPHVLQPVEWVDGALVAYSLGNFLFDQPFPDTRDGAILRIRLDRGSITAVEAIPTVARHGRVQLATGDAAAAILKQLRLPAD